ncbi:hypothetical protein DL765_002226 [Monosporascus sp. GIB2]|nr:hypothetical protein DL765_002226 [Monosporascus sp. GIB2]
MAHRSPESETPGSSTSSRKRPEIVSDGGQHKKNRKVRRACDFCKLKKLKCSGTIPCDCCTTRYLTCVYDTEYRRGRPPTPPPAAGTSTTPDSCDTNVHKQGHCSRIDNGTRASPLNLRHQGEAINDTGAQHRQSSAADPEHDGVGTSRGSPEIESSEIDGQYFDQTSNLNFLHRAWKRLSHEGNSSAGSNILSRAAHSEQEHQRLITAGDKAFVTQRTPLVVPDHDTATRLLRFYFEECVVTYRCFHQGSVAQWLSQVVENAQAGRPLHQDMGHAKAAIVMTILAIVTLRQNKIRKPDTIAVDDGLSLLGQSDPFFCAATSLTDEEKGLPTLESAQARVLQVLYLLQTARMNQAWTFWVAYMIDKYLAVVFGRPRLYHDDDIDQEFPDCVNDEDMTPHGRAAHEPRIDCHVESLIFHARLAQLIDRISRDVYSIKTRPRRERLESAHRLGRELHEWRQSLPPHLGSVKVMSLIPPFRRQAAALKLAYCHAVMHANRPFLLEGTVATGSEESAPLKDSIEECINAARVTLETVDAMAADDTVYHALWWTPYATFCALAVVYVWEIQVGRAALDKAQGLRGLLELAERCRQHLAKATWEDSPSRRYSVVLEELRQEAKYQSTKTTSQHITEPLSQRQEDLRLSSQDLPLSATATNMIPMELDGQFNEQILSSQQGGTLSEASLFDGWQTADWLDLDSLVFGPFPAFEDFSNLPK